MRLSPEQTRFLDAADRGDVQTVRAMLASGVDVNTPDHRCLPRNRTALMHAARNGHLDVVEALLAAGAKVEIKDKGLGVALPGGNTALVLALKNKHVQVAQRLLRAGASPLVKTCGFTVFGQAAYLGDVALVRQLLKLGLDPDPMVGKRTDTPLTSALFEKQTDVVRLLLSAGARPNRFGQGRVTPLELAIKGGHVEAVQLLLHHGADPDIVSSKGFTPLLLAVQFGQKEIVSILVKREAALNARSPRGQTALDLAQQQLDREVDDHLALLAERQGLEIPGYLKLYQDIAMLLRDAGAKTGNQLPPGPRGQSKSAPAKPGRSRGLRPGEIHTHSGVKDFLEFVHYTEPEFSVIAVRAPIEKAAGAFAEFRGAKRWMRNVPRHTVSGSPRASAAAVAVVKIKRNPWVLIFRSIFRLGRHDHTLIVEDAKELSARLKTRAVACLGEETAKALGYHFFEKGKLLEQAQWLEESSFCWFKSRFRRKPQKDELGEEFTDKVFRQQGIYLPACYAQRTRKGLLLRVEKVSAGAIQRADIVVLRKTKTRRR